jgi:HupE / UreJ protein
VPRCFPLVLLLAAAVSAHDIPSDVTVHVFLRPSGAQLSLLVRVPLKAIRDLDFPESEQGYLDVERLAAQLPDAATVWIARFVQLYEDQMRLPEPRVAATRISLPSDRSFSTFNDALAHLRAPPMTNRANVVWNQVLFDVLLEYPIRSERSQFSIRPGFEGLAAQVVTVLRFLPPGGAVRAYEFDGDPGVVALDPSWFQAARRFVQLGFFHILDGTDHLLFLLCLVLPVRRIRPLLTVVTAFTVAHSFTLIASAYGLTPGTLWFPPLIETLIAASIVYMALENIVGGTSVRHRWVVAFAFGLVHGFGFSFALKESLQFGGSHLLASLVSFNIGVELGQILVLCLLIPLLGALFRFVVAERIGTIILSALVAHTGWHWMLERWDHFRQFRVGWPWG